MVPSVELPPVTSFTFQVTEVLAVFSTVAVNCCVAPAGTVTAVGATEIVMISVIVTVAEADLLVSACETALTVTEFGSGTVAGAVYRPLALIVPTVVLPSATSLTSHFTAVFEVFRTVAVK